MGFNSVASSCESLEVKDRFTRMVPILSPTYNRRDNIKQLDFFAPSNNGSVDRIKEKDRGTPLKVKRRNSKVKYNRSIVNTSLPSIEVKHIIEKCNEATGQQNWMPMQSDINNQYNQINKNLGVELVTSKVLQKKTIETADKIMKFSENPPHILRVIFEEDNSRMMEQSQDEVNILKQFEHRKLNTVYNSII